MSYSYCLSSVFRADKSDVFFLGNSTKSPTVGTQNTRIHSACITLLADRECISFTNAINFCIGNMMIITKIWDLEVLHESVGTRISGNSHESFIYFILFYFFFFFWW